MRKNTIINIERCFKNNRTLEDAYAESYALFFIEIEKKIKSSNDTFEINNTIQYNNKKNQEDDNNGRPNPAA